MTLITTLKICSTNHVATLFKHRGSPDKRASEYLRILEKEKLIEGFKLGLSSPKVWRLTKKGRVARGVDYLPISWKGHKLAHNLAIADAYCAFAEKGTIRRFFHEPREEFLSGSRTYKYAPDAYIFIEVNGRIKAFILEVQVTSRTEKGWREKWHVARQFFEGEAYRKAKFQILKSGEIRPQIVVISNQMETTIKAGSGTLPLLLTRSVNELTL